MIRSLAGRSRSSVAQLVPAVDGFADEPGDVAEAVQRDLHVKAVINERLDIVDGLFESSWGGCLYFGLW